MSRQYKTYHVEQLISINELPFGNKYFLMDFRSNKIGFDVDLGHLELLSSYE